MYRNSLNQDTNLKNKKIKNTKILSVETECQARVPTKAGLLHYYLLVGYYTLLIPFKVVKSDDETYWKTSTWLFQRLKSYWFLRNFFPPFPPMYGESLLIFTQILCL